MKDELFFKEINLIENFWKIYRGEELGNSNLRFIA